MTLVHAPQLVIQVVVIVAVAWALLRDVRGSR